MTEKQSIISGSTKPTGESLNLEATELRLGPPGSESPSSVAGAKRGFSDVNKWVHAGSPHLGSKSLNGSDVRTGSSSSMAMENKNHSHNNSSAAAIDASNSKAQVVGWPPIKSFRKNTMATNPSKTNGKAEQKLEAGSLYVKVSMDGAPYLRKVDLNTYGSYAELSADLEKMFSCFTIGKLLSLRENVNSPLLIRLKPGMTHLGQYGYNGVPGRDGLSLSGSRLKDLPHASEQCVLTYEDKDGDWMLVGDVPWDMFTNTCTRIRITKSSQAIGLRCTEDHEESKG